MEKGGQVTIFVIVALVVVGVAILFFAFTDAGKNLIDPLVPSREVESISSIQNELEKCILNDEIIDTEISNIFSSGGEKDPRFFYLHQNVHYKYLCYSSNHYESCVNQQPLLLQFVESEIKNSVEPSIIACVKELEKKLQDKGYDVSSSNFDSSVDIIEGSINFDIDYPLKIKKEGSGQSFDAGFKIKKPSQAHQLIFVSSSIIEYEIKYGDSDPVVYMSIYPNTRVEKLKQIDGTTLYKISDRNTMEEFNFATRSYALPPGYGF